MERFIWLQSIDDVEPVAKALNKDVEEIQQLLTANAHDDKYSVFHVGIGDRQDVARDSFDRYPREVLERFFMERLYDQAAIYWSSAAGSVVRTDDYTVFNLHAVVSDIPYHQRLVIENKDLDDYPKAYGDTLNRMVDQIDLNVKIKRYGPMH